MQWQHISTAPKDEHTSFLVWWENPDNAWVVVQASWFEGYLYPDALGGNVGPDDALDNCTHWMPLPEPPK